MVDEAPFAVFCPDPEPHMVIGGSVADPSADSAGNINIIEAAVKKGVKKFVLVRATAHCTKLRPPFLGRRCGSVCPAER